MGRYLEPDPVALQGEMNGFGTPDWPSYAFANPVKYSDRRGENPGVGAAIGLPICGPPCAVAGFLAGVAAAAVIGKIGSDVIDQCRDKAKDRPKPSPTDPGYAQYLKDTEQCGIWYTDDAQYDACMTQAWKNYIRCLNGLPWQPMR